MAVNLTTSGHMTLADAPEYDAPYTVSARLWLVSHPGDWRAIFVIGTEDGAGTQVDDLAIDGAGRNLFVATYEDDVETSDNASDTTSLAGWVYVTLRRTAAGNLEGLANGEVVCSVAASGDRTDASQFNIGAWLTGSDRITARICDLRVWEAELTDDEIKREMLAPEVVRTSGLWCSCPMAVHTDLSDTSGNGRDFSAVGTLSTAQGPFRYVAASGGVTTGSGGIGSPWTLAKAVGSTGASPGDVVLLREGTYGSGEDSLFTVSVAAFADAKTTFANYPGERVTIDGRIAYGTGAANVRWLSYGVGLDLTCSTEDPLDLQGVNSEADGCEYINLLVHDYGGNGLGIWDDGSDQLVDGCILWNNGRQQQDSNNAYHIYCQNQDPSIHRFRRVVGFHGLSYAVHAFATSGFLENLHFERMRLFTNALQSGRTFLIGGTSVDGFQLHDSTLYTPFTNDILAYFGQQGNLDTNVAGSVLRSRFLGGAVYWSRFTNPTFRENLVRRTSDVVLTNVHVSVDPPESQDSGDFTNYDFDLNAYRRASGTDFAVRWGPSQTDGVVENFSAWKSATGLDASSTFSTAALSDRVDLDPSPYEYGRAHITIENWSEASSVNVDLSSVLQVGDSYTIHHVFDLWGDPVASGTYDGNPVAVPMTSRTSPAPPGGWPTGTDPGDLGPEFGVFLLLAEMAEGPANQIARPISDVSTAGWTTDTGSGTGLATATSDESDTTYIQSSTTPDGDVVELLLDEVDWPEQGTVTLWFKHRGA